MPISRTELESLRDELVRARASGLRVVMYDGHRTEYGSDAEMASAIADLERRIAADGGKRPRRVTFKSSKGF
ncbi:phage head-tail joining protein [Salipiger marinus]|uniref:phage head-tail joining protein n=1 Tax=Salipiger marinus TaxID=555512 RepID=UPI002B87F657|nr:hypothetical protein [Salipiger manganoxidans]MEB3417030.1 hypothetical protein [Salipiger manganoxidans]